MDAPASAIVELRVGGFKSLAEDVRLPIRPLTILAGANSSGKSSALQPLLLLKQTLEASYDPGPLLLHGPHVRFTTVDQMLSKMYNNVVTAPPIRAGIRLEGEDGDAFVSTFRLLDVHALKLGSVRYRLAGIEGCVDVDFDKSAADNLQANRKLLQDAYADHFQPLRLRFFALTNTNLDRTILETVQKFRAAIAGCIHVPGTRGNPERSYPTAAIEKAFPGTFEKYTASIVHGWQERKAEELEGLCADLRSLRLTWALEARQVDAVQIELRVARHASPSPPQRWKSGDLVNVADVGFGVSQVLPVLVALRVAEPGQLVYLEQPEIHLHPRAQVELARILATAADRGVRVVAETHSDLLLLSIRSLVAKGELAPESVILHWFEQRQDGSTEVTRAELDEAGAYGDWPEDFGDVSLRAEQDYLDAVEELALRGGRGR
ncbi:MAG: hypothetical protein D6696_07775 [Acidobacteria bacterium]|nr:MAG: hypothetical protein D6696_07775 [Acidobacteriota bacterium]